MYSETSLKRMLFLLFLTTTMTTLAESCEDSSKDTCTENLPLFFLPPACENFTLVQGDLRTASAVILGEHHDQSLETMKCLFALMEKMTAKEFAVFFEGHQVKSKEQVLRDVDAFKRPGFEVYPEGRLFESICKKASTCASWDRPDQSKTAQKLMHLSIEAFAIEKTILPYLQKNSKLPNKKILTYLQSLQNQDFKTGSYLDETGKNLRKNAIQKIIDVQRRDKKTFVDAALSVLNDIKKSVSPLCDNARNLYLHSCLQENVMHGSSAQKRNKHLEELVKKAKSDSRKKVSFFQAGQSHATSNKWGTHVARLQHKVFDEKRRPHTGR